MWAGAAKGIIQPPGQDNNETSSLENSHEARGLKRDARKRDEESRDLQVSGMRGTSTAAEPAERQVKDTSSEQFPAEREPAGQSIAVMQAAACGEGDDEYEEGTMIDMNARPDEALDTAVRAMGGTRVLWQEFGAGFSRDSAVDSGQTLVERR